MIEFSSGPSGRDEPIIDLCASTFTASAGDDEGARIRRLVTDLLCSTPEDDVVVFRAHDGPLLLGCIAFSRLRYDLDDRTVFLLAPVAVRTDRQGEGIGQRLLAFGLAELRRRGVDVVLTYGDPSYYSKVGFQPITEDVARAPLPLSLPHGWLGQSLTSQSLEPFAGACRCVPALDSPDYW